MIALPFLKSVAPPLQGKRIYLRPPTLSDYRAWASLRAESREFLAPWEPLWAVDDLERGAFRHRIRHYDDEAAAGTAHPFFLFRNTDQRLLGGITLGNIRRGVGQNGMIGYWIGAPFAGQGFMHEALSLLIPYAFTKVRLHRLEAACIPSNERSIRLLEKAGFQREGLLRSYLKINGMWQDHLLFALIEDDARAGK
ncbi:ribosomal-protein-alanine N-acetyltransferase [Phyllobacterium sp. YR620]|jgi:ribosomal-protein-alanine N-acetyltransferase|uniref:GNAT family N-acetyltransferase n=1 Tax=Phyllobacterium pellucidum TaxID=2740464 RepID=A0A849VJC8_9HYPH|nr:MULTISPECIES: GNAT family protein [Phyllobacterium]MRG56091.1 GNAT family N-acetyltransferase [Phyllobacterium sp. SYP-B3895]NTS30305.1 GNAT family N-acetyltransferase [Phyllobacterium pellucidum]SDP70341.1 ribosomal-protein-alanine N-acetyltransferase [Phyllobacterium sp. YR620]SFI54789.1 ribosomal-protein-alanine N-acetyltransferase [Phyllobacterium sp. CL33Tsu]